MIVVTLAPPHLTPLLYHSRTQMLQNDILKVPKEGTLASTLDHRWNTHHS